MKYKVGDVVYVKNREEIDDSKTMFCFASAMEKFCGQKHVIHAINTNKYGGYYTLEDDETGFLWHESWLRDPDPDIQLDEDDFMKIFE